MKIPAGYIVAIEGIDAVGKNTQSLLLSKQLRRRGVSTVLMSFPDYHTSIGREIKSFLSGKKSYPVELQHLLFAANRWEKCEEIRSHLRAGQTLIVDRYTASNLAYGKANGLDAAWLSNLERGLPAADLVIVLDASPKSMASRRANRTKDAYERSSALQRKVLKTYRELASEHGWKLIDANTSVRVVHAAVLRVVKEGLERDRGALI